MLSWQIWVFAFITRPMLPRLYGDGVAHALAAKASKGRVGLIVGEQRFDLTPREADRSKLVSFLTKCDV